MIKIEFFVSYKAKKPASAQLWIYADSMVEGGCCAVA